jgi:hypothetical protein
VQADGNLCTVSKTLFNAYQKCTPKCIRKLSDIAANFKLSNLSFGARLSLIPIEITLEIEDNGLCGTSQDYPLLELLGTRDRLIGQVLHLQFPRLEDRATRFRGCGCYTPNTLTPGKHEANRDKSSMSAVYTTSPRWAADAMTTASVTHVHAILLAGVFVADNGSPVFHPLTRLDDSDLADLLQVIRVRLLGFLERKGIIESRHELTLLEDDFCEREPALAQLAAAAGSRNLRYGSACNSAWRSATGRTNVMKLVPSSRASAFSILLSSSSVFCGLAANTALPLESSVRTSPNPALSSAAFSAVMAKFVGVTPRRKAA